MSNTTKSPMDAVAEIEAKFSAIALKGVLEAHATGLQAAASLIADVADEIANDQSPPVGATSETWRPEKWSPAEARAVSKAMSDLNAKIMARIQSVKVTIAGQEG